MELSGSPHPESVVVTVLGPLGIRTDESTVPVHGRVRATLLALLAVEPGRVVPTDLLMEEAWAGAPPRSAAPALRVHLAQLRGMLGRHSGSVNLLIRQPPGYRLDDRVVITDGRRFERMLGEARRRYGAGEWVEALRESRRALAEWRGPAFVGLEDVATLAPQIRRLEDLRIEAEDLEVEARIAAGDHVAACSAIQALVEREPLRERRTQALMIALYRAGRQADALAACRRLRHHLAHELGLEPTPEIQHLEGQILRHDAVLAWKSASPLQHPAGPATRSSLAAVAAHPPDFPIVRDLVLQRTSDLPDGCLTLLRLLAVFDRPVPEATLASAMDAGSAEVRALVDQTSRISGLLRADGASGAWCLHGAEIGDALLAVVPAGDRRELHRAAGRALEATCGSDALPEVAEHLLRAGPGVPASRVGQAVVAGAQEAMHTGDVERAVALCRQALDTVPELPVATRIDLLLCWAVSAARSSSTGVAEEVWAQAVQAARETHDIERFALAVLAHEWARRTVVRDDNDVELLFEALRLLGPRPSALRIRVASALLAEAAVPGRQPFSTADLIREVRATAPLVDDLQALVSALHAELVRLRPAPGSTARIRLTQQFVEHAAALDDPYWRLVADLSLVYEELVSASAGIRESDLDAMERYAAAAGSARLSWHVRLTRAAAGCLAGRFAEADRSADEAAALGAVAGIADAPGAALLHRFLVQLTTGSVGEFLPVIRVLADRLPRLRFIHAAGAVALAHAEMTKMAEDALSQVLRRLASDPIDESYVLALALAGEAALALPYEPHRAGILLRLLAPRAGQFVVFGQVTAVYGPVDRLRALLLARGGRVARARDLLDSATAQCEAVAATVWAARCRAERDALDPATVLSEQAGDLQERPR